MQTHVSTHITPEGYIVDVSFNTVSKKFYVYWEGIEDASGIESFSLSEDVGYYLSKIKAIPFSQQREG